jgi:endonuclease G
MKIGCRLLIASIGQIWIGLFSFGQAVTAHGSHSHPHLSELPELQAHDVLITHKGYSLVYDETHEQARWVAYELTGAETDKLFGRTDDFMEDPLITTGSATDADYKASGYDRGHIAPASDMGWSAVTMAESFYYSNMSPQEPSFNRGIWKKGEDLVRNWARAYGNLLVVAGPVLHKGLKTIGLNAVSVPELYYKVILDPEPGHEKGIAFVMANEGSRLPLTDFVVTIDSVERLTGINFFPTLAEREEKHLESAVCLECWIWTKGSSPIHSPVISPPTNTVEQPEQEPTSISVPHLCGALTKKGKPCRNRVKAGNQHCYLHGR